MLRTSGTLNKCVGQYINAFLKKKRKIERESQRKWGGGGQGGWGAVERIKEEARQCASLEIQL